jgi:hypothetical protein
MKQKLFIFGFVILLVVVLVGLNAASYTQKEKTPDNEITPNRSTFNSGATGTQAYYTLLAETGRRAVRWQEPPAALLATKANKPTVFVITGNVKRGFSDQDTEQLLRWVSEGGRLVIIDREPPEGLAVTTANWKIVVGESDLDINLFSLDPADQKQMTADSVAIKPVQPSIFSASVNAIQPSKLAASITIEQFEAKETADRHLATVEAPTDSAPVVHFAGGSKNLVVEAPFGSGKIVFLADPYIVSNGGIAIADNAQLAINLAASVGTVAFDEYHQGFGNDSSRFLQFFAGTPVVAIFVQAVILIAFVFFSQSRRFARAVPEREPDRLSKLEYVSAMAELQSRTKAYDLAVENIYTEFRRRAARLLGLEVNQATSRELAIRIEERTGLHRDQLESCLFKCEEIIRGEPTSKRQVISLTAELRSIEQSLGIKRTPRATN